jgi:hypothetical protein
MIGSRKQLTAAQDAHAAAERQAAALDRRLLGIESEIGDALHEAPRCAHPKQPCEYKSCGPGQRRAALEWALGIVRRDRQDGSGEAAP